MSFDIPLSIAVWYLMCLIEYLLSLPCASPSLPPALQLIARMSNCDPALSWPRSRRRSAYIDMEIYLPSQWVLDFCPTVRPRWQTSIEDLGYPVFRSLCLYGMNLSLRLCLVFFPLENVDMVRVEFNATLTRDVNVRDVLRPMLQSVKDMLGQVHRSYNRDLLTRSYEYLKEYKQNPVLAFCLIKFRYFHNAICNPTPIVASLISK